MRVAAALVVAAGIAGSVHAGTIVQFQHLSTINVAGTSNPSNAEFVGNNPSALAWNGSRLFVAGWAGSSTTVQIVEVTDFTTNPNAPTFGTPFATRTSPANGGFTGLELSADGNTLYSSIDQTNTTAPNGREVIQAWNVTNPLTPPASATWSQLPAGSGTGFRGSAVANDPGFNGGGVAAGGGVGFVSVGNGRVGRIDPATGDITYAAVTGGTATIGNGFAYFVDSSTVRALDFNPATGDAFIRANNDLVKFTRTGDNAGTAAKIGDLTNSTNVGTGLAFLSVPSAGEMVIFNDRALGNTGQSFLGNLRLVDPAGNSLTPDFGTFTDFTSNGFMDFDYDPATQTLAVLNFSTGRVDLFYVVPAPGTAGLLGLGGLLALRRRR